MKKPKLVDVNIIEKYKRKIFLQENNDFSFKVNIFVIIFFICIGIFLYYRYYTKNYNRFILENNN